MARYKLDMLKGRDMGRVIDGDHTRCGVEGTQSTQSTSLTSFLGENQKQKSAVKFKI